MQKMLENLRMCRSWRIVLKNSRPFKGLVHFQDKHSMIIYSPHVIQDAHVFLSSVRKKLVFFLGKHSRIFLHIVDFYGSQWVELKVQIAVSIQLHRALHNPSRGIRVLSSETIVMFLTLWLCSDSCHSRCVPGQKWPDSKQLLINLSLCYIITKYWIHSFCQLVFFHLGLVLCFYLHLINRRPHLSESRLLIFWVKKSFFMNNFHNIKQKIIKNCTVSHTSVL